MGNSSKAMRKHREESKSDDTAVNATQAPAAQTMQRDEDDGSTTGCFCFCRGLLKLCRRKKRCKEPPEEEEEITTETTASVKEISHYSLQPEESEEPDLVISIPSAEQSENDTLESQKPETETGQEKKDVANNTTKTECVDNDSLNKEDTDHTDKETLEEQSQKQQAIHPGPPPGCPQPAKSVASAPKSRPLLREHVARLTVPVPLAQRRLVVGHRGETLQRLQAEYGGVRVTVPPPKDKTAKGVTLRGPRGQVEAAAQAIRTLLQDTEAKRQQSTRKKVVLTVPPDKRRHVVGRGGEALHAILQEYQEVRVTVPPPQDTTARGITLVGPKDDVAAVATAISRHLEAVEVRLQEAKREKKEKTKDRIKINVPVAPSERRLLVGHKGEALQRLLQQCEGVRVTVPPQKDTTTQHVTVQGPKDKVDAAAAAIGRRIQEKRQMKERRKIRAKAARTSGDIQQAPKHPRSLTLGDFLPPQPQGNNQGVGKGKTKH
uniref:K Homology domain-containing protein n=1 Tax=Scylla olivacea TaxID=85551 RepID=A0A0P4VVI4_SCYOL